MGRETMPAITFDSEELRQFLESLNLNANQTHLVDNFIKTKELGLGGNINEIPAAPPNAPPIAPPMAPPTTVGTTGPRKLSLAEQIAAAKLHHKKEEDPKDVQVEKVTPKKDAAAVGGAGGLPQFNPLEALARMKANKAAKGNVSKAEEQAKPKVETDFEKTMRERKEKQQGKKPESPRPSKK